MRPSGRYELSVLSGLPLNELQDRIDNAVNLSSAAAHHRQYVRIAKALKRDFKLEANASWLKQQNCGEWAGL